jgi:hypothetical protein
VYCISCVLNGNGGFFAGFQVAMSGYGEHEGGHEHHHHKHHHESEREERREEEEQRHNINEGRRSHDNQGYGDEDHHGYSKSALRKEDVSFSFHVLTRAYSQVCLVESDYFYEHC